MTATASTTPVDTRHRPLTRYLALAAVVLAITIAVFIFSALTSSGSTAAGTDGGGGYEGIPAMPH